jgi:hypothetical protein
MFWTSTLGQSIKSDTLTDDAKEEEGYSMSRWTHQQSHSKSATALSPSRNSERSKVPQALDGTNEKGPEDPLSFPQN